MSCVDRVARVDAPRSGEHFSAHNHFAVECTRDAALRMNEWSSITSGREPAPAAGRVSEHQTNECDGDGCRQ